jgi:hypothetical protein
MKPAFELKRAECRVGPATTMTIPSVLQLVLVDQDFWPCFLYHNWEVVATIPRLIGAEDSFRV